MATRILMPLPDRDFDVTEVAVPWRVLTRAGHQVIFATQTAGTRPACDPLLIDGVIFGQLGAAPEPISWYRELEASPAFRETIAWSDVDPAAFDGLVLPGGHAPGMKQYLGSELLQAKVAAIWKRGVPVGAICHGVLVLARAKDPATGKSVLAGKRTTCLVKPMERSAYLATFWKLGKYYRTYPEYVEDEVKAALDDPKKQLQRGPGLIGLAADRVRPARLGSPSARGALRLLLFARGTDTDDRPAFVVEDGAYVSARWPGDAYLFAKRFSTRL